MTILWILALWWLFGLAIWLRARRRARGGQIVCTKVGCVTCLPFVLSVGIPHLVVDVIVEFVREGVHVWRQMR